MGWTGLYHHAASDYLLLTQHDRYHLRASGERGGGGEGGLTCCSPAAQSSRSCSHGCYGVRLRVLAYGE